MSNELGQIVVLVSLVITCHGDQRREVSVTQFLPSLLYTHCTVALHCTVLSKHCADLHGFLNAQLRADSLHPGPDDRHHLVFVSRSARRSRQTNIVLQLQLSDDL